MLKKTMLILGGLLIMTTAAQQEANAADPANIANMELSSGGTVVIELLPDIAPKHVERIKTLAGEGFYDGIIFHRVISGFMAQTGDPTGTGMGGSKLADVPAEFSKYPYKRGTIGMARSQSPDSANSQFFICFTDTGCSFLTGQYTVLGQVTSGMEFIDAVAVGEPPASPDKIIKMTIGGTTEVASETTEAAPETTEAAPETTEAAPETTEAAPETTEAAPETTEEKAVDTEAAPEAIDTDAVTK